MKKLLIILLLFLSSCSSSFIEDVDNPDEATTLQIQRIAKNDSVQYKLIDDNGSWSLYNVKTNKVEKKIIYRGLSTGWNIIILIVVFAILFGLIFQP